MAISTFWIWLVSCFSLINYMKTNENFLNKPIENEKILIEKYDYEYRRLIKLKIAENKDAPIDRKKYEQETKKIKLLG